MWFRYAAPLVLGTAVAVAVAGAPVTAGGSVVAAGSAPRGAATLTAALADPDGSGQFSVAFEPGGTTLAVGDGEGSTLLWDTRTRKLPVGRRDPQARGHPRRPRPDRHWGIAFSPDGTALAAGDYGGTTYLWRITRHAP
jgi:WD40 repeat protein